MSNGSDDGEKKPPDRTALGRPGPPAAPPEPQATRILSPPPPAEAPAKPFEATVALTPAPDLKATPAGAPAPGPKATLALTPAPAPAPDPKATLALTPASSNPSAVPDASTRLEGPDAAAKAGPAPSGGDPLVGQRMGVYKIERRLAEGGMGVVYEATHEKLGRRSAIKVLRLEYCQNEEVVQRFYQEARSVNEIRHENIVDVFDFGRDPDGRVYLVMEFLEGESLAARLHRGNLTWSEALPLLEQIIRALKAAHEKGFVHRDLKPDNIWLRKRSDGGAAEVKVLDFGIAKLVGMEGAQDKLTRTGSIIGTPHYMSPEQINGAAKIDQRSDIYSLGVIVYELFAGVTPFPGESLGQILTGHLLNPAPRLTDVPVNTSMPTQVADVVDGMLVKDPTVRYQTVADVLADLRAIQQKKKPAMTGVRLAVQAPTESTQAPTTPSVAARPSGGNGLKIGIAVMALAAAAVAVIFVLKGRGKKATTQQPVVAAADGGAQGPGPDPVKAAPIDQEKARAEAQTLLRASLKQSEPKVRVEGSDALAEVKDEPSVPTLGELVEKDPDPEVRAHAASALGVIGATDLRPLLAKLEKDAAPALAVWLAEAQARMGDAKAKKRLLDLSEAKELSVAYKAALALADVSAAGDPKTIARLTALAGREAELNEIAPYAGAVLLTRLARLQHAKARDVLYGILESSDEGSRLAGAEGLARLGDQAAQKPLADVLANTGSANRLPAAVALISLGDYSGFDLINERSGDKDPVFRRLSMRGLGEIGEPDSLRTLVDRLADDSWSVRIAAGLAILKIVGLDPKVLAQASVDWAMSALASEDWAVRNAAAGLIGEIPEKQAAPLLASAIADPDPRVRRSAVKSARKLKSEEAVTQIVKLVDSERDESTREEAVKSLGGMGSQAATPLLTKLSDDPKRVGVYATGSLIALGHKDKSARLDEAIKHRKDDMRIAAIEAATYANDPIAVPTLIKGSEDKELEVRLLAAEGLVTYKAEPERAAEVFTKALGHKNPDIQARSQAGLLRLNRAAPGGVGATPEEMLRSTDVGTRRAAVTVIAAMEPKKALPLLRRTVHDTDAGVRRAGLEAAGVIGAAARQDVIRLEKQVLKDPDPALRARAKAQLARLIEPKNAAPAPAPAPVGKIDLAPLEQKVVLAEQALAALLEAAKDASEVQKAIEKEIAAPAKDDAALKVVGDLLEKLGDKLEAAEARKKDAEAAASAATTVFPAPAPPEAAPLLARVSKVEGAAGKAMKDVDSDSEKTRKKAKEWLKSEESDATTYLAAAEAGIATGKLSAAKKNLDQAAKVLEKDGQKMPALEIAYATLYHKMAIQEDAPAAKLKLLKQAKSRFDAFVKTGSGGRVARAKELSEELADEIKELEAAAP